MDNTDTTLEQLQALVDSQAHMTIYRKLPERDLAYAFTGRLTSASGPFPPYGFAVSYHDDNGDRSYLALPPDWEWRIDTD